MCCKILIISWQNQVSKDIPVVQEHTAPIYLIQGSNYSYTAHSVDRRKDAQLKTMMKPVQWHGHKTNASIIF